MVLEQIFDLSSLNLMVRVLAGIVALLFLVLVIRVINSSRNDLEWADLISVPGRDGGRPHADWDKVGKGCGVWLCVWLPVIYAYSPKMEAIGLASIMAVALLYLGAVSAYSATLRSRQVTTVTEPATDLSSSKVTVIEASPVVEKKAVP